MRAEDGAIERAELFLVRRSGSLLCPFRLRTDLKAKVEGLIVSQIDISRSGFVVLRSLVAERTAKEMAEVRGKSLETVRSQTRSVAAKIGLSRRSTSRRP